MKRELMFSLVGFLGGFVVAAVVFWQPGASSSREDSKSAVAATGTGAASDGGSGVVERTRRPVVMSAPGDGPRAEVIEQPANPKTPAELMHEMLATLSGLKPEQRQVAANDLIKKLREMGPAGLQAVRDFMRAGEDVKFQGGFAMVNGKMTMAPSLRVAFLAALADWPGADAVELTREVLRSTSQISELGMAIRQLEAKAPGAYRTEAIQALVRAASSPGQMNGAIDGGATIFQALREFKAPELIPLAEKLVEKNGWFISQFVNALNDLPANVRQPAIERIFANPETGKQLASNPYGLQGLSYTDPLVSRNVAQIFGSNMDKKTRENFLMTMGNANAVVGGMTVVGGGWGNATVMQAPDDAAQKAQLRARLGFLDQIAPQCATPVLQERLQDAREAIQKAIARPPVQPRQGSNNINATSSVFQVVGDSVSIDAGGGGIQVIQQSGK